MTKSDLILSLAQQMNITLKEARSIVDTIINTMTNALEQGQRVELRGFGTFEVRKYEAYIGRNPKTGATFEVAPKKLPIFRVSKNLLEKANSPLKNTKS